MIQDIAPHTFDNHYLPDASVRPQDPVLVIRDNHLLCQILPLAEKALDPTAFRPEEQIHDGTGSRPAANHPLAMEFPTWDAIRTDTVPYVSAPVTENDLTYLFTVDEDHYFLLSSAKITGLPAGSSTVGTSTTNAAVPPAVPRRDPAAEEGHQTAPAFCWYSLRDLREAQVGPRVREFAATTAMHLAHWYENNRFCGRCGTPTVQDTVERALRCPHCGNVIYPRIVPAVIVGILNPRRNSILLTRYRTGYTHYALVAGFTEIGETLEGTVRRETMEETGLHVTNIRYYKSQPWGIVDDILAGFWCEVEGDDTIHMDRNELRTAEWVTPENVELQPQDFSLTNEMMYLFKTGKIRTRWDFSSVID